MVSVMDYMSLALFTTLGTFGAGGLASLSLAFFNEEYSEDELRSIDKRTLIPFVVLIAGFVCVIFHVTAPFKAYGVFEGLGRSPLSDEIIYGIVFCIVAAIYVVLAYCSKLHGARKVYSAVLAVMAIILAIMMGLAYMLDTIPSWNNIGTVCQTLGSLLMGVALGFMIFPFRNRLSKIMNIVILAGMILVALGLIEQSIIASGMPTNFISGSLYVSAAMPYMIIALILAVLAALLLFMKTSQFFSSINKSYVINGLLVLAVLFGRIAFYVMQVNVGL